MHKHHVTPKYRDPNSKTTVEVTVTQHAMFHFCNWQLWGDLRDWVAWKGLAKEIGAEELFREKRRIGGMVSRGLLPKKPPRPKMSNQECRALAVQAALSPEAKAKKSATQKEKQTPTTAP